MYIYMRMCIYMSVCVCGCNGRSVRQWPVRPGFNPRSSHTKDSKNGT